MIFNKDWKLFKSDITEPNSCGDFETNLPNCYYECNGVFLCGGYGCFAGYTKNLNQV